MSSSEFDRDTAVTPVSGTATSPATGEADEAGRWTADLVAGWSVGGGLNGGYLQATLGRALARTLPGKPHPVVMSTYYVGPGEPGEAEVRTRVVRAGGASPTSTGTVAGELVQGGRTRLSSLATFADLDALPDLVETTATPPEMPPVEQCVRATDAPPEVRVVAPLMERLDLRFDPAYVGWAVGRPSGEGRIQGWIRLPGREPDPLSLLLVLDALPPVTFDLGRPGWAPTLELTSHVRAVPAPGWLRVSHRTRNVAGGLFEEDCEVWDSRDRLVAQARQLARFPR